MDIYFIYAEGCYKCKEMENVIRKTMSAKSKIIKMECDTEEAVDYAIENGINDLPACVINGIIIQGENFNPDDIKNAIKQ